MSTEHPHKDPFTTEDYEALIMARARGAHPNPLNREDLDRFIQWCLRTTIQAAPIQLMIKGKVDVKSTNHDGSPNELYFHHAQPPPES